MPTVLVLTGLDLLMTTTQQKGCGSMGAQVILMTVHGYRTTPERGR